MIGDFHFIRPWWLFSILPLALLVWAMLKQRGAAQQWKGIVAPHLLPHLLVGRQSNRGSFPIVLIAAGWLLAALAIAGPAWKQEPNPFADDTAAMAIVIKVSPSMLTEDIQPNRLARGVQKVHDLLNKRAGAKSALIAYAGTAHMVMPATSDAGIIESFAQALDPRIMPSDGDAADAALRIADSALANAGGGSLLWITDSIATEQEAALKAWRKQSASPLRVLPVLLPGPELDALTKAARGANAKVVELTADSTDVANLANAAKFAPAIATGTGDHWKESGYWITPCLALLLLVPFRKGWMAEVAAKA